MATISYARTNSTSQAQAAIDALEDALTRQGAYTKMATIFSDTSQPCSVWKSSGTRNALGRDWYLLIARPLDTSPPSLSLGVAEGFDQGLKSVIRPAPGTGKTAMPAEDFSYGGGIAYPIWSGTNPNPVDIAWQTVSVSTSIVDVWAIVTNDTVAITRSIVGQAGGSVVMAGIAEPFRDDDPGIVFINGSTGTGAVTRHPTIVAPDSNNWAIANMATSTTIWTQRSGKLGGEGDRLHNSRPVGSRVLIRHTGLPQTTGILRGLHRNVLSVDTATGIYSAGEKMFVGPDEYQYPGDAGGLWLNTAPV